MENNTFYNQEIKESFLKTIDNPISETFCIHLFRKAKKVEAVYNRDIYDMTEEELGEVARNLSCSTSNAVYNNVVKMEEYIDWAIEKGFRKSNINPLSTVTKSEWSKEFVATYKNYYFTRDHIEHMMSELVNYTDQAILLALFEGIKGKGFSELINLKPEDITEVNGSYWAHLSEDDGEERDIEISELLAKTLIKASRQNEYFNKNGENQARGKHVASPFEDSPYIFKKSTKGTKKHDKVAFTFITRKFLLFKDVFGMDFLKAKHITDSGIMHYANELQVDEEITTTQMYEIANRFNTPYTYADKNTRYRNNTIIKTTLEISDFEELYGYKMKFKAERSHN